MNPNSIIFGKIYAINVYKRKLEDYLKKYRAFNEYQDGYEAGIKFAIEQANKEIAELAAELDPQLTNQFTNEPSQDVENKE